MEKKRITIIGVNYYPENTATGLYTTQLAEYFTERGVEVTVLTGFPYYPAWEINEEYQSKSSFVKEVVNGVKIIRYKQYVPKNPTFFKRILHLIDFTLGSMINLFKVKKTDAVLCIVPFTSTIFLGKLLSLFKGGKLWVHIQDFEFDAAAETNLIKSTNNLLFKILFWIERRLLKSANITSTISKSMLFKLEHKNPNTKEKLFLPNWVDLNDVTPQNTITHPYMNSPKFKILYSGNIGEKQDWAFFLKFAEAIAQEKDIEIVIVGDGSKKEWLVEETKSYKFIKHYKPVPYEELSSLLCNADVHFLFQKENVKDTVMPSKILAMMASKKPSLITGNKDSEVREIIQEANAGKYFQSTELDQILAFIHSLQNGTDRTNYGGNARSYVSEKFSKDRVLDRFYRTYLNLINQTS